MKKKIFAISFSILLVLNLILFAARITGEIFFWLVIIAAAIISFLIKKI